tara:strand:- start:820 stop:3207 length:2388 start_codon:yes stop_codon:yes gene_type:complete
MTFAEIYQGCTTERGILGGIVNNKKKAWVEPNPFDYKAHLEGKQTQGLSPVDVSKRSCRWLAFDVDQDVDTLKFCQSIWKLDNQLFPFRSLSGRWHIHYILDDWTPVDECVKLRSQIEKKIKSLGYIVDTGHSLPKGFDLEKEKPGCWIFLPYSNGKNICYSPRGNPLSLEQFEFRVKWRKIPLIAGSVGLQSGQGSRDKHLFSIALYLKHYPLGLTIDDVNKYFNEPLEEKEYQHIFNSIEKYDKEYFDDRKGIYLKEITGVKTDKIETTEEDLIAQKQFLDKVWFIKKEGNYYDNNFNEIYPPDTINNVYRPIFKEEPTTFFKKQIKSIRVEEVIYRPQNYNPESKLITVAGKLYINSYEPSKLESIKPTGDAIRLFFVLLRYLFPDPVERTWVLDFLCTVIQKPGEKIRHSILVYSKMKQIGKGSLFRLLRKILGEKNCTIIGPEQATDRSREFLIDKQLVLIDEIISKGDWEEKKTVMNVLKPVMIEDVIEIRPLYKPWRMIETCANYLLYTNIKDALSYDDNEERFTVIANTSPRMAQEFYDELHKQISEGTLANVVKYYLENRTISPSFKAKGVCLKTNAMKEMGKLNKHPVYQTIEPLIFERTRPFDRDIININEVWANLKKHHQVRGRQNEVAMALEDLGCVRHGSILHLHSGRKPTLWSVRNHEFYQSKELRDIANDFWVPLDPLDWGVGQDILTTINHNLKDVEPYMESIGKPFEKTVYQKEPEKPPFAKKSEQYDSVCWKCHKEIELTDGTRCPECDYAILCDCGVCACDKPGSKIKKKQRVPY